MEMLQGIFVVVVVDYVFLDNGNTTETLEGLVFVVCNFCKHCRIESVDLIFLPRKPNLAIAEHTWPGLVKKELTFGGK